MDPNCQLAVNSPNVVSETIDGEVIIINLDNGAYYSLRMTGAEIWACIEESASAEKITTELCRRYGPDTVDIRQTTNDFLGELLSEQLVRGATDGERDPLADRQASRASAESSQGSFERASAREVHRHARLPSGRSDPPGG